MIYVNRSQLDAIQTDGITSFILSRHGMAVRCPTHVEDTEIRSIFSHALKNEAENTLGI